MDIQVVSEPELRIVALKVEAPEGQLGQLVPPAWERVRQALPEISEPSEPLTYYGVFPTGDHREAVTAFTYWVGVGVKNANSVPHGFELLVLPARRYAVATVQGPADQIERTYEALLGATEGGGLRRDDDALGFELYRPERQEPYAQPGRAAHYDFDIYLPLAR